jgi:hypothetical protein
MSKIDQCSCGAEHSPDLAFFVTVRSGARTGFLLGPYGTHAEALANVDRGRDFACAVDAWAHFYSYGTASVPAGTAAETVFGIFGR